LKKYWGCKYNPYNPGSYAPGQSNSVQLYR